MERASAISLPGTRRSDVVFAVLVVFVLAMLFVPIPTSLLDILLVTNISFSILLLLVSLYMPNALALLSFPSILLLTTLFRLSLNVASTRLILTDGYAGEVISAFGTFLIRGEILVGVVIFTIITVVNFIVIARGSSRVSEVAARFALDALPGKQMALDADLRAGLITPVQARQKRDDLRKESQLYGSMDGAMKFVQGDAIAGFIIIVANIVVGMIVGLTHGQSFSDALSTYTILTVGDGLVTQIPALLTSICAGIVVTRVAASDQSTLGSEVTEQLLRRPGALFLSGILLLFIAALPGLPTLPFLIIASAFVGAGWVMRREGAEPSDSTDVRPTRVVRVIDGGRELRSRLAQRPEVIGADDEETLLLRVEKDTLFREFTVARDEFDQAWQEFRRMMREDLGVVLPNLIVESSATLNPWAYTMERGGNELFSGGVPSDSFFAPMTRSVAMNIGFEVVDEGENPVTGQAGSWCSVTSASTAIIAAGRLNVLRPLEVILLRLEQFVVSAPQEFLSLGDVHSMVKEVEKRFPGLLVESLGRRTLNFSRLTEVCQELVRLRIGVRDFRHILETVVATYATYPAGEEDECDVEELVRAIRRGRRRQIVSSLLSRRGTVRAIGLSDRARELFEGVALIGGGGVSGRESVTALRESIITEFSTIRVRGTLPIVVLAPEDLFSRVVALVRTLPYSIPVLSMDDIEPSITVERVGVW